MSALFTRAYEQVIWVKDVALDRYKGLPRSGKVAVWVYFALHIVIGAAVWWITPTKLLERERHLLSRGTGQQGADAWIDRRRDGGVG